MKHKCALNCVHALQLPDGQGAGAPGHPGLFLLRIPQQAIEPYGQFGRADRFENIVVDAEESRLAHIEVIGAGREQGRRPSSASASVSAGKREGLDRSYRATRYPAGRRLGAPLSQSALWHGLDYLSDSDAHSGVPSCSKTSWCI